jgi:sugar phosphate isomerase/epimerase
MNPFAVSTWSLHGVLGQAWYEPDAQGNLINKNTTHSATSTLLELPALAAKEGITLLEICHFHFPSIDDAYLSQLKDAMQVAGVGLANVLIDTGNLSSLDDAQWRADIEMTKGWQDVAVKLGADSVRIDCGLEPATAETIKRSADALRELADYGTSIGLTTTTENWRTTSIESRDLLDLMQQVDRPLNLCLDFGNAEKTDDKFATINELLPFATSLHCKANYDGDIMDTVDINRCLALVKNSDFDGFISLIYGDTENEWDNIVTLKDHVEKQML